MQTSQTLQITSRRLPHFTQAPARLTLLSSAAMVAGMVVFENGRPLKNAYRRFSIKELTQQNDYAAMQEVIRRRFHEYFKAQQEQNETAKALNEFGVLPDLILLDGGQTHVGAIAPILEELGL